MNRRPSVQSAWLLPMGTLASVAVLVFGAFYAIDRLLTGGPGTDVPGSLVQYVFFDPDHITDGVSALGAMIAGVLGIVISVVSIVVQLSAERYAGVTGMFFRDRTNVWVLAFYVVACVCGVLVSLSVRHDFAPRATLIAMVAMCTVGLVLMAPYFAYVFRFLEPTNIIARIRREAVEGASAGATSSERRARDAAQEKLLFAMEELTDITSNSISGKDKIIASRAVDALKDLAVAYLPVKGSASPEWFLLGETIRDNPDFVAMAPESLADLEERRTWVEWKILRQYLGIYNEALSVMRDIDYLVAIDTRYVGEAALEHRDEPLVELVLRFMNSYLRATLNAKDVRTAYNVLNQYRLFVETMLRKGSATTAVVAARHLKYYGDVSFDMKLNFVVETIGYDLGALCQLANELGSPAEGELLDTLLTLDRASSERGQEQALKGVRKAQVKLAAHYLSVGDEAKARQIQRDMAAEPRERLRVIRDELERVETKDFWEIIDRGRNFEFMPPAHKARMAEFFGWFERA